MRAPYRCLAWREGGRAQLRRRGRGIPQPAHSSGCLLQPAAGDTHYDRFSTKRQAQKKKLKGAAVTGLCKEPTLERQGVSS
ncbi:unnamed protein product, partial [Gulo gulo]